MALYVGVAYKLHGSRLDGQRVYHDHELVKSVLLVQLIDSVGIDVGLACASLHLDVQVQHSSVLYWLYHLPVVGSQLLLVGYLADGKPRLCILQVHDGILVGALRFVHWRILQCLCQPLYGYVLMGKSCFKYYIHKLLAALVPNVNVDFDLLLTFAKQRQVDSQSLQRTEVKTIAKDHHIVRSPVILFAILLY